MLGYRWRNLASQGDRRPVVQGRPLLVARHRPESDVTDIVADAGALPLADDSVDLILCIAVLQHIRDYVRVLDEMARVLRPGGVTVVTFPFIYGECDVQDFRRWTLFRMTDELERAGCTVINAEPRGGAAFATVAC